MLQLRSDVASLQTASQRARGDADALVAQVERRLREQSADTQKQLAALSARLDTISTEIATLATRTEDLNQRLEATRRAAVAPRPPAAPAAGASTSPASPPASAPATSRPTTGALQPEDIYQAAYIDFSKASYQLAVTQFREFLRRFPEHKLADNAQYWIGESHLGLAQNYASTPGQADKATGQLEEAVREFRRVITNYPRGDKVPTALYKEALALLQLKQVGVAQERLQYLIDNFPRAEEATLARDRLAGLKQQ